MVQMAIKIPGIVGWMYDPGLGSLGLSQWPMVNFHVSLAQTAIASGFRLDARKFRSGTPLYIVLKSQEWLCKSFK